MGDIGEKLIKDRYALPMPSLDYFFIFNFSADTLVLFTEPNLKTKLGEITLVGVLRNYLVLVGIVPPLEHSGKY